MTHRNLTEYPIDAVIPWVDGADPQHVEKLGAYLASIGGERPLGAHPERFHHSGELDYCVTSLLRFAPWLRKIYIVTDNQIPSLISVFANTEYEERVVIVDHKTIFLGYENYLPTFNSNSISTLLYRIPGLSENFLFLNDDFALIRPVTTEDFFRNNKIVVRGMWRRFSENLLHKRIHAWAQKILNQTSTLRPSYLRGQQLSAKLLGFTDQYFQIGHNPHPWRTRVITEFFAANSSVLEKNLQSPLRSANQFVMEALATHLEIANGHAIIDNLLSTLQLKPGEQGLTRIKRKLFDADHNENVAFVCVQSIESATDDVKRHVFSWLDQRIGSPSALTAGRQKLHSSTLC